MEELIMQLEAAAETIMAPPNMVTNEQRHKAEEVFLDFRKTKSPYGLCRQILETTRSDYVLFEAAELLKNGLIREWSFLQESDIISLRQYLMNYITSRHLPPYVLDRILQVVAIIVKRASVDDGGHERSNILTEVENLIINADPEKKILGCNIISRIMQEYESSVKAADVGLSWEIHYKAKKDFETTDMKRIFQFCVQLLSEIVKTDPPYPFTMASLLQHILTICESILTWGIVYTMLPKRIVGFYEAVYKADQAPALRLGSQWEDTMLAPQFLPLMFQVYWKVRDNDDMAHLALSCLVQLATLNGNILCNKKQEYFVSYLENFLKFSSSVSVRSKESLGISLIVRKLHNFFSSNFLSLPKVLRDSYLDEITRMTCYFCEGAAREETDGVEDKCYSEAFDNVLEAWTTIIKKFKSLPDKVLPSYVTQIFNTFVHCHLGPPDGIRKSFNGEIEEIEDDEDNDRNKYKEQLQIIGMFGRCILPHSIPILFKIIEDRTNKLCNHLQMMQSQAMTINDSAVLDNIFEDLHWVILIAGHVLCMECDGETALIPVGISSYSINQNADLEATLKTVAAVQVGVENSLIEQCDHSIRLIADILKLCAIEQSAAEAKLGHFMSPEVSCTLMWFLKRWCSTYLTPVGENYAKMSPVFLHILGENSESSVFIINFILAKIQSNISHFNSEPILLQDTVDLFINLLQVKQRAKHVIKSSGLWNLLKYQESMDKSLIPPNIRRGLYKGFVQAGIAFQDPQELCKYLEQVLKPVELRFKNLLNQENLNRIYLEETVQKEVIDILECLIGIAQGNLSTAEIIFDMLAPILSELPVLLNLYQHYQVIVQLILELFGQCAKYILCYLNHLNSNRFYENTLAIIQNYAKCNVNRLSTEMFAEESNVQDLTLVMDILIFTLSKDCLDLSPLSGEEEVTITAADVSLFGLHFIMPLISNDLMKYPSLCGQYYRLVVLINDIFPEKIANLPDDMLKKLLFSIELGLTKYNNDVVQSCLDFIHGMANYIYKNSLKDTKIYHALMPFLKLLIDLTLSHQMNTDMITMASTSIYTLICCYSEEYQAIVNSLINTQSDPLVAERLAAAFNLLTNNITLNCERQPKLKFRDSFDKFIANVHGFLLVK